MKFDSANEILLSWRNLTQSHLEIHLQSASDTQDTTTHWHCWTYVCGTRNRRDLWPPRISAASWGQTCTQRALPGSGGESVGTRSCTGSGDRPPTRIGSGSLLCRSNRSEKKKPVCELARISINLLWAVFLKMHLTYFFSLNLVLFYCSYTRVCSWRFCGLQPLCCVEAASEVSCGIWSVEHLPQWGCLPCLPSPCKRSSRLETTVCYAAPRIRRRAWIRGWLECCVWKMFVFSPEYNMYVQQQQLRTHSKTQASQFGCVWVCTAWSASSYVLRAPQQSPLWWREQRETSLYIWH